MSITPADIRAYANLPKEVPDALLDKHSELALTELQRLTGLATAPDNLDSEWREAQTVQALASVYPWLNTFALDGAAKVGRLEGSVEARFLDADEVDARVRSLNRRFQQLVDLLKANMEQTEDAASGGIQMVAI